MTLTPAQKKITGMTLIVIFTIMQLLFAAMFTYKVFQHGAVTQAELSVLVTVGLFFFPLWLGFRLWKEGAAARQ